ncbi:unnamed protein product [Paramecium primaurelia]|uniref:Transmembrane protein n=1 Tax=Paramecium primaurelia TaxID=5886 RepID=A0A8S1QQ33_PARPR|nr:unnamed protein product [Paramecium primaurelia]
MTRYRFSSHFGEYGNNIFVRHFMFLCKIQYDPQIQIVTSPVEIQVKIFYNYLFGQYTSHYIIKEGIQKCSREIQLCFFYNRNRSQLYYQELIISIAYILFAIIYIQMKNGKFQIVITNYFQKEYGNIIVVINVQYLLICIIRVLRLIIITQHLLTTSPYEYQLDSGFCDNKKYEILQINITQNKASFLNFTISTNLVGGFILQIHSGWWHYIINPAFFLYSLKSIKFSKTENLDVLSPLTATKSSLVHQSAIMLYLMLPGMQNLIFNTYFLVETTPQVYLSKTSRFSLKVDLVNVIKKFEIDQQEGKISQVIKKEGSVFLLLMF